MDNYMVSARKYRPDTFQSVVGQSALTTTLKNAIKSNQLAHAYLFCGPRGVGKTTCARIFAKTINCMNPGPDGEACNACESCNSFNEQRSLNIFELDAASNNSVDGIRMLTDQVRIPPQIGKYKVYIIDEVHMLSQSAFNAFLKTLEEPPHHAIFILATTEKHKIIPTILSRCQIYDFSRISVAGIVSQLKYVAESENIEAEDDALNVIAVKADGGMRDALSIFDQVASYGNGKITYQKTIENLNVLDYDYYFKLTKTLLEGNYSNALLIFNEILNHGFDGQHFITGLSAHFRDLLVCKDQATLILLEVGDNIRNNYKTQAVECPVEFLYSGIKICNDCDLSYRESKNKRLQVELALIRLAQLMDSKKKIRELTDDGTVNILPLENVKNATVTSAEPPVVTVTAASASEAPPPVHKYLHEISHRPLEAKGAGTSKTGELSDYRSIPSIRPRKITKEKTEQEVVSKEKSLPDLNNKFSKEDLDREWNEFAEQMQEDVHLSNAMKACRPNLIDDHNFEVVVSNQVLQKKMEEIHRQINSFLRRNLKNSNIEMTILLDETEENSRPFTARERLEAMAKKNPNILLFYRTLGLDID